MVDQVQEQLYAYLTPHTLPLSLLNPPPHQSAVRSLRTVSALCAPPPARRREEEDGRQGRVASREPAVSEVVGGRLQHKRAYVSI